MRAKKICSAPACTNLQPCPDHQRKPWSGSARDRGLQTLTSGSRRQKRARYVIDRAGTVCHWCGRVGADEADHVISLANGGEDTIENMAPIHGAKYGADSCHAQKTRFEARGTTPDSCSLGPTKAATRPASGFEKSRFSPGEAA